ncbi:hypothetical protein A7K91_03730 [Paenibacillus oryzae]|uniref:alpha-mannosidase n=1 Tax=Paenibacillus oryzae TaxID=1844972 RepID=A0A1A5YMF7_9BACL|nr:glycoside hydrolase family 38 C-terminal domain-containing protein [Paenibacillus oryzae]OBR66560.1 hypothetical protein A7K91_03730 [Paenibacillus oryzae]
MKAFQRFARWLEKQQWRQQLPLSRWHVKKLRYADPGVYENLTEDWSLTNVSNLADGHGTTYMLRQQVVVPEGWQPGEAAITYHGGGEGLLRLNGEPYHGLDANHWFVALPAGCRAGDELLLEIELYDPIPEPVDPLNGQSKQKPPINGISLSLVQVNQHVYRLFHTVLAVQEAAALLPEGNLQKTRLEAALKDTIARVYEPGGDAVAEPAYLVQAEADLRKAAELAGQAAGCNGFMHMVGQSHIDIAWLWPIKETVRKVSRTFSTVLALMERYPDFRYSQSQPILYAFVKEYYPGLYERIKQRIAEGRWELVGGMWVEPDLNMPSGESLVRQMLAGQRFYEKEFGKRSSIEWLPDTFGYCASLPQLLKGAGVDYFMTTKLGWNDTNPFPYTLFNWVGIDGSRILAYQNHGVNEHTRPRELQEHWASFGEKDKHEELMLLYGHGDGGGGVTHEMLEYMERSALAAGQPKAEYSTAKRFFDGVDASGAKLPEWHGDLYLELHRGTYTTHARNKRSNRLAEGLYRAAELWLSLSGGRDRLAFDEARERLEQGWKLILLNQFHDIIPGTSIPEIYVTSAAHYEKIMTLGNEALKLAMGMMAERLDTSGEGRAFVVFNSLGWEREGRVSLPFQPGMEELEAFGEDGSRLCMQLEPAVKQGEAASLSVMAGAVPAFGCKTIWLRERSAGETGESLAKGNKLIPSLAPVQESVTISLEYPTVLLELETDYYSIRLNENGQISRLYDKQCSRELVPDGRCGNELQLFHDTPELWDAWDIAKDYEDRPAGAQVLRDWRLLEQSGDRIIVELEWELGSSLIRQQMVVPLHERRLEFRTFADWRENHKLLKVAFPLAMNAAKATYEIPFGALERPTHRNTSWEQAQFEVCGHRWADLSEHGYGVSLLNDCKYGYDIKDSVMRLSLLRAPSWPDAAADRGEHFFTYALYPHEGGWQQAGTVREAAMLNEPLRIYDAGRQAEVHPVCPVRPVQPDIGAISGIRGTSKTDRDPIGVASEIAKVGSAVSSNGEKPGSFHSWINVTGKQVVLDTVKPAEDGSGIVLRLYESGGGRAETVIALSSHLLAGEDRFAASQVNVLEDWQSDLPMEGQTLRLSFKPFEIKSIKLTTSAMAGKGEQA